MSETDLAFAAYLVPTFPLGYIWHLVAVKDAYTTLDIYRDQVIIPFGLTSMFIQAVIFLPSTPEYSIGSGRTVAQRLRISAA